MSVKKKTKFTENINVIGYYGDDFIVGRTILQNILTVDKKTGNRIIKKREMVSCIFEDGTWQLIDWINIHNPKKLILPEINK